MTPALLTIGAESVLCCLACLTIACGSLSSVKAPKAVRKARRKSKDEPEDEDDEDVEHISFEDALYFPIIASVALLGLFLALKYLSADLLQRILAVYFLGVTFVSFWRVRSLTHTFDLGTTFFQTFAKAGHYFLPRRFQATAKYHLDLTRGKAELIRGTFTDVGLAAGVLASLIAGLQYWTGNWLLVNLAALSLGFNAIGLLQLDSFKTSSALLAGLFCYDVFWVFGTTVMVSVATKVDGPIKISVPRTLEGAAGAMMLLGLGDIVIPGLFIAFCSRFDYAMAIRKAPKSKPPLPQDLKSMPYFRVAMFGYVSGLIATFVALHVSKHPQPALLFLSPSCIGSVSLVAWIRGETKALWAYNDSQGENGGPKSLHKEIEASKEWVDVSTTPGPRTRRRAKLEAEARS